METPTAHQPVLYNEIIHLLQPNRSGRYVDGTVGAGGHARGILEASGPDGLLLGFDIDTFALQLARKQLESYQDRVTLVHSSFNNLSKQLNAMGWQMVDGILLDLGISSMQIDVPDRGFSFRKDALLDMRFDQQNPVRAKELVNELPEGELADLLFEYGEERRSRQVARAIVGARPIDTTVQLANVVAAATRSGRPGMHPATRTFQALRIAVNDELTVLEEVLPQAIGSLEPQGRLAVISYHSLEDRIVKHYFRRESKDCICPPEQIVCNCGHQAKVKVITKRPIRPQQDEISHNPRARSARLRVVEKLTIK
ncbi:MAG TPA: 16S rRNA (cytosine(1402)-N(4))-methyltransferase RsmH [Anaerolineales bacterium]|nr:16S rRNA (cytosine(1402)-N(4))-methyltransferase RsmH [Anaerolineales bacterium]